MKTSSIAVETSRSISQSDSIVRQTNKRSFLRCCCLHYFKVEVSNVLQKTWWNYHLTKQNGLVCWLGPAFLFFRFGFEYLFWARKVTGISRNGPLSRATFVPARFYPASPLWLCYHQKYHTGARFMLNHVAPERELYQLVRNFTTASW